MTRVAILGTRHVHTPDLARHAASAGATVVAAVERDTSARDAWATDICPLSNDLPGLLADVDAAIIGGTNRERVTDTLAALEAGCCVLSEKPVAIDAADLERLLHVGHDDSRFMVALPVRWSSAVQRAKAAIASGAIGTPLAARGTNHGQFPGGWFGVAHDAGGGALQDHVVHVADALCWMLQDRAVRVYARAERTMHPQLDVDDCAVVTIDFSDGLFASIDASWSRPDSFPTWGDVWIEIIGTDGRLVIDPMATRFDLFDDTAHKLRHVDYSPQDITFDMVSAFINYAEHGGNSPVSLADGVHVSDIVLASYASVRSGHPEPVTVRQTDW